MFLIQQGELKACLGLPSLFVASATSLPGIWCFFMLVYYNSTFSVFCLHLQPYRHPCCPVYIIICFCIATVKDSGDSCLYATLPTHSTKPTEFCMSYPGVIQLRECMTYIFDADLNWYSTGLSNFQKFSNNNLE